MIQFNITHEYMIQIIQSVSKIAEYYCALNIEKNYIKVILYIVIL